MTTTICVEGHTVRVSPMPSGLLVGRVDGFPEIVAMERTLEDFRWVLPCLMSEVRHLREHGEGAPYTCSACGKTAAHDA